MATLNQHGVGLDAEMVLVLTAILAAQAGWCQPPNQETRKEKLAKDLLQAEPRKVVPPIGVENQQVAEEFKKWPEKFVKELMAQYQRDKERIRDAELAGLAWFLAVVDDILRPNSQFARAELVKYLALDKEGNLKVTAFPEDDAELAYYLLWLLDTDNLPPRRPNQGRSALWNPYDSEAYISFLDPDKGYGSIVQSYGGNVPPALVEYLFMLSPVYAWRCLADHKTRITEQDFTWTVHVLATTAWRISNRRKEFAELDLARKELQKLVDDTAWYSRRYAVRVLLSYPYFGTPELVRKLQNDPHPLVRERAKALSLQPKDKE